MKKILRFALAAVIAASVISVEASSSVPAPLHKAQSVGKKPITDDKGRIYYIVDLVGDVKEAYPNERTAAGKQRFHERHSGKAQNMVEAFEKRYGFDYVEMTSWVGDSFSAYLNPGQVEQFRADPRVTLISEVVKETVSAPWYDSTISSYLPPYYETHSWGRNAVNGKISNNTRRIHIIDTGVGYHEDLPNVIARVNASCGTNNNGCPAISPVGCYPHATHVAGIIGAAYGNKGVAGVNAGAKMISVSTLSRNNNPAICADPYSPYSYPDAVEIAIAMDWVKWDIIFNGGNQPGIVNISMNGTSFGPNQTNRAKMLNLASIYIGGYYYPGAFIAQSAGNQHDSACYYAFSYANGIPSTTDGIMVVGGINNDGQPVTSGNGGYTNAPYAQGYEPGSNYGSCVEVWAPSKAILSTWGPNAGYNQNDPNTWQSQWVMYDNYVNLSGTSMAAPHIAAIAAYLAETQQAEDWPGGIELAVRNFLYNSGQVDGHGLPVNLIRLP